MTIRARLQAVGGAIALAAVVVLPGAAGAAEVVRMGELPYISNVGLYVAIDKRHTAELERALCSLAPAACWTIERISASRGLLAFAST